MAWQFHPQKNADAHPLDDVHSLSAFLVATLGRYYSVVVILVIIASVTRPRSAPLLCAAFPSASSRPTRLAIERPQSQNEEAAVTHRRHVCAQFAAIGTQVTGEPGKLQNAAKIWQIWQETCQKSADSRHTAMAKTFARELVELQSVL